MSTNEELEIKIDELTSILSEVVKTSMKRVSTTEDRFRRLETAHNNLVENHNALKNSMLNIFSGDDGK